MSPEEVDRILSQYFEEMWEKFLLKEFERSLRGSGKRPVGILNSFGG